MSEGVAQGHPGLDPACPSPLLSLTRTNSSVCGVLLTHLDLQFWCLILLCVGLPLMPQQTEKSCSVLQISVSTHCSSHFPWLPLLSSIITSYLRRFLCDASALLLLASSMHSVLSECLLKQCLELSLVF